MARLLLYYAHPGHRYSNANYSLCNRARGVEGITLVDLYATYPRFDIDVEKEQQRLLEHDVLMMQFPMFWYSTPSLMKEWIDLVLQHGFAFGEGGDALRGKTMMLAITAAGTADAYQQDGYQHYPIRTFLTPLEQTARLCGMEFPAPYVLHDSLRCGEDGRLQRHCDGYQQLLEAIRDDRFDFERAASMDIITADAVPMKGGT